MSTIENIGGALTIVIARNSDFVMGIEIRDDSDALRPITTLLVWLEDEDPGFTWAMVEPGSFTVTLPRSITSTLDSSTSYTIGFVDEASLHQPLLTGLVRLATGVRLASS
jgi:hypothetical protein